MSARLRQDLPSGTNCGICQNGVSSNQLICSSCHSSYHVPCLAKSFSEELLPVSGACPTCSANHSWADLIKAMKLRVSGQPDEFEDLEHDGSSSSTSTSM